MFEEVILEQKKNIEQKFKRDRFIERDVDYNALTDRRVITVIVGARQVGKTTLLGQLYLKEKNSAFVSFEDERLIDLKPKDLNKIMEAIYKVYDVKVDTIFLDEIQNIPHWEKFVRRLFDEGYKIYLSGSNTHNLKRDLSKSITGRHIDLILFPFSFREILKYYDIKQKKYYTTKERAQILKKFDFYLTNGGFPRFIKTENYNVLISTFEDILYKDVYSRIKAENITDLRSVAKYLANALAKKISYNKIKETLSIRSPTTVKKYVSAFEDAFLFYLVEKYDESAKRRIKMPKKVFCVDNGIRNILVLKKDYDLGNLLENVVFLELKRKNKDIYYFEFNDRECDFVYFDFSSRKFEAIQVTYELNKDDWDREVNGLKEAMDYFGLKEGLLLTYDQEEEVKIKGKDGKAKKIIVKPVWKWLLE